MSNVGLFFAVLCALTVIVSEVISGLGVSLSLTCETRTLDGLVSSQKIINLDPEARLLRIMVAVSQLVGTHFSEGPLQFVPLAVPIRAKENLCLKCLNQQQVLKDCIIENGRTFENGELEIGVIKTDYPFYTVTDGIRYAKKDSVPKISFKGYGDLVTYQLNAQSCAIFFFAIETDFEENNDIERSVSVTYFEYINPIHCFQIREKSSKDVMTWVRTENRTYSQNIRFTKQLIHIYDILESLALYRSFQTEFDLNKRSNQSTQWERLPRLTEDDIYRAILARQISVTEQNKGTYEEYTECGVYHWIYIIPFIGTVIFLFLIALIAYAQKWILNKKDPNKLISKVNDQSVIV